MMADKKEATEYVILIQTEGSPNAWTELGSVKASSQAAAKRQGLAQFYPAGGIVTAVPSRSWEPEDLKPKLSFG